MVVRPVDQHSLEGVGITPCLRIVHQTRETPVDAPAVRRASSRGESVSHPAFGSPQLPREVPLHYPQLLDLETRLPCPKQRAHAQDPGLSPASTKNLSPNMHPRCLLLSDPEDSVPGTYMQDQGPGPESAQDIIPGAQSHNTLLLGP